MKRVWVDVTVPLSSGMVHWPGDPDVKIERIRSIDKGDTCNVSLLELSSHTGTHVDAPLHFLPRSKGVDKIPLETLIGPARVVQVRNRTEISPEELRSLGIRVGERLLFKTPGSSARWRKERFDPHYVYLPLSSAEFLAQRKVKLLGIDYLSIAGYKKEAEETHRVLLGAGVVLVEGLNLERVTPGRYFMICLPLRIRGADGAPARVILKRLA